MGAGYDVPEGVDIRGRYDEEFARILTKNALQFVTELQREFRNHIMYAMECRKEAKMRYNSGALPGFDPATKYIRKGEWTCAPVPPVVADRKVEIIGPVERKMIINALNSGAKVFIITLVDKFLKRLVGRGTQADFEDALPPCWENLDAVNGTITFHDKARNRIYKLNDQTAKLFVRPRGWHLHEAYILIDGEPETGCLVDFGLYFFHNFAAFRGTQGQGYGPFFYLPKMEHSREAKIWNSVFERAEKMAGIEWGSIRATVLIETLPAVFQMDEILYELRDHSIGLNCGRWDYIFSYVKTFQAHPDRLLPDRVLAAQIPVRDDLAANEAALELGNAPHQIQSMKREDAACITGEDLLQIPRGVQTMDGLRLNTRVGIQYLAAWLTGTGKMLRRPRLVESKIGSG
ncbi:Malate synthase [Dillenia turbinata]|uniref:Malate synthase n=1 Tax=Dillenia turbinata TaxID=194707 RepID=A0AAN8VBN8_9MAGN